MGFLGRIFKKEPTVDPLEALRLKVEALPNDARLAQDLAARLKARGETKSAIEYCRRAANVHREAGFAARALAVLRGAMAWGEPSPELLSDIADLHLELRHKEDARGVLLKLRAMHVDAGNRSELGRIDARLQDLGPGR
jgi:hypothetical protein